MKITRHGNKLEEKLCSSYRRRDMSVYVFFSEMLCSTWKTKEIGQER